MKAKEILIRALTGLVLVTVTIGAVYAGGIYTAALFWIIFNAGLTEWARLCERTGVKVSVLWLYPIANLLYFSITCRAYAAFDARVALGAEYLPWCTLLLVLVFVAATIFAKTSDSAGRIGAVLGGSLYTAGTLALLNYWARPVCDGGGMLMGFFLVVWATDVFAYLLGSAFGSNKMAEKLSPSKTWEGTVGGVLCAAAVGLLWGRFMLPEAVSGMWLTECLMIPLACIFGDLLESKFKRDAGVKDAGNILPGHGGILDRYDSVFLAAPIAVAISQLFRIF